MQVTSAAGFLKKPIQQHCELSGAVWYHTKQSPPCCFQPDREEAPFYIIWLPLTGQGNTFNHICPLLPWKCVALDAFLCVFWRGYNTQYSSRNEMVQCLTCFEWYHCVCLGISLEEANEFHDSGLWLHVAPPISEPRHVSVQWNPYFSNLLITRTLEMLFPFSQSNTVTFPRFLKLPYYLKKVLFMLNVGKNLDSTVLSLLLFCFGSFIMFLNVAYCSFYLLYFVDRCTQTKVAFCGF